MASGKNLILSEPIRMMLTGYPGAGKTGSIASLVDAGFKVRVLDFEGNFAPMLRFADPNKLDNVDIVTLSDAMRLDPRGVQIPSGPPTAFTDALRLLQEWKYKDEDGQEVNLGRSSAWGPDTVVVLDSLTGMSEAAFRRAAAMMNKQRGNITSAVWGAATEDVSMAIQEMTKLKYRYHLIVISHLRMIGPSDFLTQNDDKDEMASVKEAKLEAIGDNLIPVRLYPRAVTKNQSQIIHKEFPTFIRAELVTRVGKTRRVLVTQGGAEIDLKMPSKTAQREYPLETGMVDIFRALGVEPPKMG